MRKRSLRIESLELRAMLASGVVAVPDELPPVPPPPPVPFFVPLVPATPPGPGEEWCFADDVKNGWPMPEDPQGYATPKEPSLHDVDVPMPKPTPGEHIKPVPFAPSDPTRLA